jgi:hypothetical protein
VPNDFAAFRANSLCKGTGNFWSQNRDFPMGIREFLLLAADGLAAKLAWQAFIDELRLLGFARALIPLSNIAIFD